MTEAWARRQTITRTDIDDPPGLHDLLLAITSGWTGGRRWVFVPAFMDLGPFDLQAARAWATTRPVSFSDVDGTVVDLAQLRVACGFRELRECVRAWNWLRRSGYLALEEQHMPWICAQDGLGQLGRLYSVETGSGVSARKR